MLTGNPPCPAQSPTLSQPFSLTQRMQSQIPSHGAGSHSVLKHLLPREPLYCHMMSHTMSQPPEVVTRSDLVYHLHSAEPSPAPSHTPAQSIQSQAPACRWVVAHCHTHCKHLGLTQCRLSHSHSGPHTHPPALSRKPLSVSFYVHPHSRRLPHIMGRCLTMSHTLS